MRPPGSGSFIMSLSVDRPVQDGVQLLDVADALGLGEAQELPLQRLRGRRAVVGRQGVVERHGGAVLDRLGDRVLVEVALRVVAAEDLEGALAVGDPVDGRAGEADVGGVGQGAHQVVAEVAARGAVGLVHQHEDVLPRVEVGRDVVELVNHRDDQAAVVRRRGCWRRSCLLCGDLDCAEAVGGDVPKSCCLQLVAVHEHEHGRVLAARVSRAAVCWRW